MMKRVRGSPSKGAVLINEDDLEDEKEVYMQARWHAQSLMQLTRQCKAFAKMM